MSGWLNIYKEKSISSAHAVRIIKKYFKNQKIGHAGTLDVEAEGILPIAIGEATKLTGYLIEAKKEYFFTIKFGAKTSTADHTGEVIQTTDYFPTQEQCENICEQFIGVQEQIPPAYSAIKVNGVRSYKLARNEQAQILKPRSIEIFSLESLNYDPVKFTASYVAKCSKGTYIRTLGEDIALSLQSLGFVIELRRSKVGVFEIENSISTTTLDRLDSENIKDLLISKILKTEIVLDDIPVLDLNSKQAQQIIYGQKCFFDAHDNLSRVWLRIDGRLLAIGSIVENYFISSRVFNLV